MFNNFINKTFCNFFENDISELDSYFIFDWITKFNIRDEFKNIFTNELRNLIKNEMKKNLIDEINLNPLLKKFVNQFISVFFLKMFIVVKLVKLKILNV